MNSSADQPLTPSAGLKRRKMEYPFSTFGMRIEDLTLGNLLRTRAAEHGARRFLLYLPDGRSFTFKDLETQSNKIGNGLRRLGVSPRDHVAVIMENSPEQLLSY